MVKVTPKSVQKYMRTKSRLFFHALRELGILLSYQIQLQSPRVGLNQILKQVLGKENKLIALNRLKPSTFTMDRSEVREMFGNRLKLKNDSHRTTGVMNRIVKGVKQKELDPNTNEKWSHDRFHGTKVPVSKQRTQTTELVK